MVINITIDNQLHSEIIYFSKLNKINIDELYFESLIAGLNLKRYGHLNSPNIPSDFNSNETLIDDKDKPYIDYKLSTESNLDGFIEEKNNLLLQIEELQKTIVSQRSQLFNCNTELEKLTDKLNAIGNDRQKVGIYLDGSNLNKLVK